MVREYKISKKYKVNDKCIYVGKLWGKLLNIQGKLSICDNIYIGDTHQIFNKIIDVPFYDVQRLLKNGHKSESFSAHFEKHFKYTISGTDLRKCMIFKLVNHINNIVPMKSIIKPNYNICI